MSTSTFPASAPGFDVPAGAVDCHIHIVGSADRFPFTPIKSYAVPPATVADYKKVAGKLGVDHAVVVQPSFYGADNSCLVAALEEAGGQWRGVAVAEPGTPDDELQRLHAAGVRGTRLNLASAKLDPNAEWRTRLTDTAAMVAKLGWHVQLFTASDLLGAVAKLQPQLVCPLVIDHFGLVKAATAGQEPMSGYLSDLCQILDKGGWVKLSGLYRVADKADDPKLAKLARRLFDAYPDRCVWGSDWPHTPVHGGRGDHGDELMPYRGLDTGRELAPIATWLPREDDRNRLLVTNPSRLYDI